jgi:hypothetical protein
MKRVRIERPRVRREPWWREDLPPGPLDPEVVQAKALTRARQTRYELTGPAARARGQRKRAG